MRKMISLCFILASLSMLFSFSAFAEDGISTPAPTGTHMHNAIPPNVNGITDTNRAWDHNGNGIDNRNMNTNDFRATAAADDNDFDWGWLGLVGLLGLTGLKRNNRDRERT